VISASRSRRNAFRFALAVLAVLILVLAGGRAVWLAHGVPPVVERAGIVVGGTAKDGVMALADPETGGLRMQARDGSAIAFGNGDSALPKWMPDYRGSDRETIFSMQGTTGSGSVGFRVKAPVAAVCAFYERSTTPETTTRLLHKADANGCLLLSSNERLRETALVSVGAWGEKSSSVNVTYTKK